MTTLRILHSSFQLLVGMSILGASSALAPAQEAAAPAADESGAACKCTCDVCREKHGAKPVASRTGLVLGVAEVVDVEEPKEDPVVADELLEITELAPLITFAAPVASGSQERGYLGVTLSPNEEGDGARLLAVVSGSPAAKAGLQGGDLIIAAEEFPVASAQDLITVMSALKVGDTATIEFERDGAELQTVMVNLGRRSVLDGATSPAVEREAILPDLPDEVVEGERRVVLQWAIDAEPEEVILAEIVEIAEVEGIDTTSEPQSDTVFVLPDTVPQLTVAFEDVTEGTHLPHRPPVLPGRWVRGSQDAQGGQPAGAQSGPLPEGYVEITTRRERRPAANAELAKRIQRLEAQVSEMEIMIMELRRELDRRNPR